MNEEYKGRRARKREEWDTSCKLKANHKLGLCYCVSGAVQFSAMPGNCKAYHSAKDQGLLVHQPLRSLFFLLLEIQLPHAFLYSCSMFPSQHRESRETMEKYTVTELDKVSQKIVIRGLNLNT